MSAAASPCWLAPFASTPCEGRMDRAHLLPKSRLKREFASVDKLESAATIDAIVWHPSLWVWACRRHHGDFDNHVFRLARAELPAGLEEAARILGMEWSLDRDFGPAPLNQRQRDA